MLAIFSRWVLRANTVVFGALALLYLARGEYAVAILLTIATAQAYVMVRFIYLDMIQISNHAIMFANALRRISKLYGTEAMDAPEIARETLRKLGPR